jgi:hypothetical protein
MTKAARIEVLLNMVVLLVDNGKNTTMKGKGYQVRNLLVVLMLLIFILVTF